MGSLDEIALTDGQVTVVQLVPDGRAQVEGGDEFVTDGLA